jgi:nucleotide-binding universal stress UspA family protein
MPAGFPAHSLLEVARDHDVSAVVLGSHGKGIFHAKTLGSVSSALLHEVKRPILVLRSELMSEGESDSVCRGMFSRVLFPTDFSDIAERALNYLGKIALETRCALTLVHVAERKPHHPLDAERQEEAAHYLIESKKRRLESLGALEVAVDFRHGHPSQEIVACLQETKSTLIVMGTHGKGLIQEVLLGSVAHHIAHLATVPIMYIPAGACCP